MSEARRAVFARARPARRVTTIDANENDTIEALSRYRYTIIRRAAAILNDDGSIRDDSEDATRGLAGLLAMSLEELKVAEEELRSRSAALVAHQAKTDERTHHYRELFVQGPSPAMITDVFGTIVEANLAAGHLFRRTPDQMARKPVDGMVPSSRREEFRREFARLSHADGPRDWHFSINRLGDVPLDVCATVKLVPGLGPTSSGVLYWMFASSNDHRGMVIAD
jgi:PAS domain-containing protein